MYFRCLFPLCKATWCSWLYATEQLAPPKECVLVLPAASVSTQGGCRGLSQKVTGFHIWQLNFLTDLVRGGLRGRPRQGGVDVSGGLKVGMPGRLLVEAHLAAELRAPTE